ncbi:MAG: SirB2 family protein [Spongiibacteraceae bacterium]
MTEYYPLLKSTHLSLVLISGTIFILRGLLMLCNSRFGQQLAIKRLSYANDTLLLLAGVMLTWVLGVTPLNSSWLAVKLLLLLTYIVLGVFALRLGRSKAQRCVYFIAALCCYFFMISVARSHNPMGLFVSGRIF